MGNESPTWGKTGNGIGRGRCVYRVASSDGSGPARNLTERFDFNVYSCTVNDIQGLPATTPPVWSNDGKSLYFQVSHHGSTVLKSVSLEGELHAVIDNAGAVLAFSLDRLQSKLTYFHADLTNLGQILVRNLSTGRSRRLTRFNQNLLHAINLGEIEEAWFKGAANNDLQEWMLKPPDFDPSERYPSILEVHGGPFVQYGSLFMHAFYYLAAQGYVVYFCNPRSGQGYGEAHAKATWNNWGTVDYEDLIDWVDFVQQKP